MIEDTGKLTAKKDLNNIDDIAKHTVMRYAKRTGSIGRSTVSKGVRVTENIEKRIGRKYVKGIGSIERHTVKNGVSTTGNIICCIHEPRIRLHVASQKS